MLAIMLPLILILTVLDIVTTMKALQLGAVEMNPITQKLGFNIYLKLGLSIAYCIIATIGWTIGDRTLRRSIKIISISLVLVLFAIVINNIIVVLICVVYHNG